MITLYHAPLSRSHRVRWLLEELGLPYQLETRSFAELKTPAHLAIHPLGKVPAIRDGDLVMFESGAIVQYLLERYGEGRLEPKPGSPERAAYLQWFHFAEATVTPPIGLVVQHTRLRPEPERIPAVAADAAKLAKSALAVVDAALGGRPWLAGDFSAADVMMGYSVKLASFFGLVGDELPQLRAYLARCEERPAFRKAAAA